MDDLRANIIEIKADLKETTRALGELVKLTAIHNHILNEHHKRSTHLEERMRPLEDDFAYRRRLYALLMGSSGVVALISLVLSGLSLYLKLH